MMRWSTQQQRVGWTVLALAAAAVTTVHAVRASFPLVRQVVQRHLALFELHRLQAGVADDRNLVQAFAATKDRPTLDPTALIQQSELDGKVEWREKERKPLTAGWTLRTIELEGQAVPFAQWAALLARLEQARPAVQVTDVSLQAADGTPGTGRATAAIQLIEAPAS